MDLDELRSFIAVVDSGSFSAAAKSLNFARTTLRKQITELETRSGVQLLKDAADGASVTRAGHVLAEKGRFLLSEARSLFDAVRTLDKQDDLLVFEVPLGLPPQIEQSAYKAFRKAAPALRWRVRYTTGVFNEKTDASFVLHHSRGDDARASGRVVEEANWRHTRVARLPTGLVASKSYLEEHGTPENVDDLSEHNMIVWERSDRDPLVLPLKKYIETIPPFSPSLISPNAFVVRQFAQSGLGIALAPSSRMAGFFEERSLVQVLKDEVGDTFDVWTSVRNDAKGGAIGILASAMARFAQAALSPLD
jgi:DNA-binding transcriptional LysR family regulator